jgi:hypothetical protein
MPSIMWLALAIPGLLALYLLTFHRRATKWWELAIPAVATVILIVVCQVLAVRNAVNETEYLGYITMNAVHEEPFSYDSECPETYPCGTTCDSKGNCTTVYCTRWVHCVEYSGRECYLVDNKGQKYGISQAEYENTQKLFQNYKYSKNKIKTYSHGYTTIGDKYNRPGHGHKHEVFWDGVWNTSRPIAVTATYENRLHTLSSWRNYTEEEVKALGLFKYPAISSYSTRTILGANFPLAETYAKYLNGRYGSQIKVRLWILVFNNQDRGMADEQEIYWKGGNKNEFVIMMNKGADGKLTWAHIMSPTEIETLKIEVRDKLSLESFEISDDNMLAFIKWLEPYLVAKYVKPDYRQYAYIEVVPSLTALIISFSVILVINIGIGIFVVKNDWHDHHNEELTTKQAVANIGNAFKDLFLWMFSWLPGMKRRRSLTEHFEQPENFPRMTLNWPPAPPVPFIRSGIKPKRTIKKRRLR